MLTNGRTGRLGVEHLRRARRRVVAPLSRRHRHRIKHQRTQRWQGLPARRTSPNFDFDSVLEHRKTLKLTLNRCFVSAEDLVMCPARPHSAKTVTHLEQACRRLVARNSLKPQTNGAIWRQVRHRLASLVPSWPWSGLVGGMVPGLPFVFSNLGPQRYRALAISSEPSSPTPFFQLRGGHLRRLASIRIGNPHSTQPMEAL